MSDGSPDPTAETEAPDEPSIGADATADGSRKQRRSARAWHRLGRFVVLSELGRGGMGIVYSAYDEELERKVAIKLILGGPDGPRPSERERFLREAKAMARLSHPNVAQIFEVGVEDDHPYLAMELVDGITLAEWLERREGRPGPEVLDVFRQAALGLAAAHESGLVHRDFKPQNVMVTGAGRVVVLDFGVARAVQPPAVAESLPEGLAAPHTNDDDAGVVGTPAYMAPEQLDGEAADARADQYAFCIALYEALAGVPPFPRTPWATRLEAAQAESIAEPEVALPTGLDDVIRRGLKADPDARWPSMAPLIEALAPQRRGWWPLVVVGAIAPVLAVAGAAWMASEGGEEPCDGADARADAVWDASLRERVERRLADDSGASMLAEQVSAEFDAYVERWKSIANDSCAAAYVRGERSVGQHAQTMTCLDGALAKFDLAIRRASQDDAPTSLQLGGVVAGLADPANCRDVGSEASSETLRFLNAAQEAEVEAQFGKPRRALEIVAPYIAELDGSQSPLSAARVRLAACDAHHVLGGIAEADQLCRAAAVDALTAKDDAVFAMAAAKLVVVSDEAGRYTEARTWGELGLAAVRRGARDPHAERLIHTALGNLYGNLLQLDRASESFRAAIEIIEERWGAENYRLLGPIVSLAGQAFVAEDTELARELFERALAIAKHVYGDGHGVVFVVRANLAAVAQVEGRLDEAEAEIEAMLAGAKDLSAFTSDVGAPLGTLSAVAYHRGDLPAAIAWTERALEQAPDQQSELDRAMRQLHLAAQVAENGELDRARKLVATGREKIRSMLGEDHYVFAQADYVEASVEAEAGNLDAAQRHLEAYERIVAAQTLPLPWATIDAKTLAAELAAKRGEYDRALSLRAAILREVESRGHASIWRRIETRLRLAEAILDRIEHGSVTGDAPAYDPRTLLEEASRLAEPLGETRWGREIAKQIGRLDP